MMRLMVENADVCGYIQDKKTLKNIRTSWLCEIGRMVHVDDEPRLLRLPFQLRAGARARCRRIDAGEHGEPAEMFGRLLGRLRNHGNVQAATDHRSDLLEGHTL